MPDFSLKTVWNIPAPRERVWACLLDTASWPAWWPYVAAVDEPADKSRHCRWLTCLPYQLSLDMCVTRMQTNYSVEVDVRGDLKGFGLCRLTIEPLTQHTLVRFSWNVATCRPWMNRCSPLLKPVFIWNHNRVMKRGEVGLIAYLNQKA